MSSPGKGKHLNMKELYSHTARLEKTKGDIEGNMLVERQTGKLDQQQLEEIRILGISKGRKYYLGGVNHARTHTHTPPTAQQVSLWMGKCGGKGKKCGGKNEAPQ